MGIIRVEAEAGRATLWVRSYVFIGTTGNTQSGTFLPEGAPFNGFTCCPAQDDFGTLVFDDLFVEDRSPRSPTFFRYWWDGDKLIIRESLMDGGWNRLLSSSPISGFNCTLAAPGPKRVYYTANGDNYICEKTRVGLLDLLRFAEGKIDEEQLKARAIK